MAYRLIFIDLDDTLYAQDNGLWPTLKARIGIYMHERLHLPVEEVSAIRRKYYETYGTTLRGLQIHHGVNSAEFLEFVHDVAIEKYLQPEPELHRMLLSLPQPCWILTNASKQHARRVIACQGLEGCFAGIIDIVDLEYHCKPTAEAYRRALHIAGVSNPREVVFIDDSTNNLDGAHRLGIATVLVSKNGNGNSSVYKTIPDLMSLPRIMPELWEKPEVIRDGL